MPRGKHINAPIHRSPSKQGLAALGEAEPEACVLAVLVDHGPSTNQEIQKHTRYTYQTVLKAAKQLEERGWIQSQPFPTEKRGRNPIQYTLKATKKAMRKHYQDILDERLQAISIS